MYIWNGLKVAPLPSLHSACNLKLPVSVIDSPNNESENLPTKLGLTYVGCLGYHLSTVWASDISVIFDYLSLSAQFWLFASVLSVVPVMFVSYSAIKHRYQGWAPSFYWHPRLNKVWLTSPYNRWLTFVDAPRSSQSVCTLRTLARLHWCTRWGRRNLQCLPFCEDRGMFEVDQ